jgi:energy-coupling factor transporter ATP-binding protein EcfA2
MSPTNPLENLSRPGGSLKAEPPDAAEIAGLLRTGRALVDAGNTALALESRFDLAYNAAHALCLAALRAKGYRAGNRYIVFQVLPHRLGLGPEVWRVLDLCHNKRNLGEYEGLLGVDERLLLSLAIPTGKLTVLMGPSGCGKSTLAKLLQGFYFPQEGQITIDGRDIRQLAAKVNWGQIPIHHRRATAARRASRRHRRPSSCQAGRELPAAAQADDEPVCGPRGAHIEQPRLVALVFALRRHEAHAHHGHHGKFQPLAGVQGQHLDGVGGGVELAQFVADLMGQPAPVQDVGAQVHILVAAAENGHVAPGVAFLVGGAEQFNDLHGLGPQRGQADNDGGFAIAPAAHRPDHGDAVFVFVFGGEQVGGDQAGCLQHLACVASVDLQNGGAPLGLNTHAFEAKLLAAAALVDALRIVAEHEQAVGGGVHHLGDEPQPLGREIVTFVDQHGLVLVTGDLLTVHALDHALHHLGHLHFYRQVVGWQRLPISHQLVSAPFVEVSGVHLGRQACHQVPPDAAYRARGETPPGWRLNTGQVAARRTPGKPDRRAV